MPTLSRNIVISLVLGLLAAGALVVYTNQVKHDAARSSNGVHVLVATRTVPAGTDVQEAFADGSLAYATRTQGEVAEGAVTDVHAAGGDVVTARLFAGDQVTASRIGSPHAQGLSYQLTGDQRAVRIPLNANAGLLPDLHAGDRVDVFTNYSDGSGTATYAAVRGAYVAEVKQAGSSGSLAGQAGAVTLVVTDRQAMWIVNALGNTQGGGQSDSSIWLALSGRTHVARDGRLQSGPLVLPSHAATPDATIPAPTSK